MRTRLFEKSCKKMVLICVVFIGIVSISFWRGRTGHASQIRNNVAFEQVLDAHGGRDVINRALVSRTKATRVTITNPSEFFERTLIVTWSGLEFRIETVDPLGQRTQIVSFDGHQMVSIVLNSDKSMLDSPKILPVGSREFNAAYFAAIGTGLLPILRYCAEPTAEVSYQGRDNLFDVFKVNTSIGTVIIRADESHLIRTLELNGRRLQFAGYQQNQGLRLPHIQRLVVGETLIYENFLSSIELDVPLEADYFSAGKIERQTGRLP